MSTFTTSAPVPQRKPAEHAAMRAKVCSEDLSFAVIDEFFAELELCVFEGVK
jgi:hypothetical protein